MHGVALRPLNVLGTISYGLRDDEGVPQAVPVHHQGHVSA